MYFTDSSGLRIKLARVLMCAAMLSGSLARAAQAIDAFWQTTREQLAREPIDAEVEQLKDPLPYKTFKVTLRSLDGVRIVGLMSVPTRGEAPTQPQSWPVIISTPGYGGWQQGVMLSECQRGYAILQIFPRSQGESAALWKIDGPDKLTWHLDRPEGAYYQGAYADVMRAIDFVISRPDLDRDRIALVGTSQGGGFSLAVGALDPRVKAVVAHVPFLCDFRLAARIPDSIVKTVLDGIGRNDEAALCTLDFFDPLQLALRLRVPVLMSAGGKDTHCPAVTIRAVYEKLPGAKELKFYPDLTHTSCLEFYNYTWPWLDLHFRKESP